MPSLSAAHFGYNHQDCITACALATILLPKFEGVKVTADRKVIAEDCFDDLELSGKERSRIQIKSHESDYRLYYYPTSQQTEYHFVLIKLSVVFTKIQIQPIHIASSLHMTLRKRNWRLICSQHH